MWNASEAKKQKERGATKTKNTERIVECLFFVLLYFLLQI